MMYELREMEAGLGLGRYPEGAISARHNDPALLHVFVPVVRPSVNEFVSVEADDEGDGWIVTVFTADGEQLPVAIEAYPDKELAERGAENVRVALATWPGFRKEGEV